MKEVNSMKLRDFLKTLKTKDIKIIIVDAEEVEHIKFYSEGFEGVESDLLDLNVKKWFIIFPTAIQVYVDMPESDDSGDTTPDDTTGDNTEPTNTDPTDTDTTTP